MKDKKIAIFSGVNTNVLEKCSPTLRASGIIPVYIKNSPNGIFNDEYFSKLAKQVNFILNREENNNVNIGVAFLVSSLEGEFLENEINYFVPSLTRLEIEKKILNNSSSYNLINRIILSYIKNNVIINNKLKSNVMLKLPVRNSFLKALYYNYVDIYLNICSDINKNVERKINRIKKGGGLRINDLTFKGTINNGRHPVRRICNSDICDIKAKFRFGIRIHDRFEFDVTSSRKLDGREFFLCDGTKKKVSKNKSHINMRINDDFN